MKTNLTSLFDSHAHDAKAFLIAFGDFGMADIDASVGHITEVSELDYVYANQTQLNELMDDFETALRPKGSLRRKASNWLTSVGIADTKLQKLSEEMESHRQAILLENAKYRQTQSQLQRIQENLQASAQEIDALLEHAQAQMTRTVVECVTERQLRLQTQLTVVNQALQAVAISLDQNKDVVDSMTEALNTGVSASLVHEIVRKIQPKG